MFVFGKPTGKLAERRCRNRQVHDATRRDKYSSCRIIIHDVHTFHALNFVDYGVINHYSCVRRIKHSISFRPTVALRGLSKKNDYNLLKASLHFRLKVAK